MTPCECLQCDENPVSEHYHEDGSFRGCSSCCWSEECAKNMCAIKIAELSNP